MEEVRTESRDVRYCRYCGSEINSESDCCANCGKQTDPLIDISERIRLLEEQSRKQVKDLSIIEKQQASISSIKKWVIFLGVVTIIGLVSDAILTLLKACS